METDWRKDGLERLFGQIDDEDVWHWPLVINCSAWEDRSVVLSQVVTALRDRLEYVGFFAEPELCLIVPTGALPDDIANYVVVYESDACDNDAYLYTVRLGGCNIISLPRDPVTDEPMTYLQWVYRVLKGEEPHIVNTMPWAHAKFINWARDART